MRAFMNPHSGEGVRQNAGEIHDMVASIEEGKGKEGKRVAARVGC